MKLPENSVVVDLGNGIVGRLKEPAEIVFDNEPERDEIAAAAVAANRKELLPLLAHTDAEGRQFCYSRTGERLEVVEADISPEGNSEDERLASEAELRAELKAKSVVELKEICKTLDLKVPHNAREERIIDIIVENSATQEFADKYLNK